MILIHGEVKQDKEQLEIISRLKEDLYATLNKPNPITTDIVISACNKLAIKAINGEFDEFIYPLLKMAGIDKDRFNTLLRQFTEEGLVYKCKVELGNDYNNLPDLNSATIRRRYPLGILFHIAAGNIDGLPAYSVIEGLLVGNINILKLPTGDSGLSIKLLSELINIEPKLKDYIYVFDVSSTELDTIRSLINLSDGVVVWGGDAAVKVVKEASDVTTKVISWGHKLSFGYVTSNVTDDELEGLALNICQTNQVLCSSCQGIYLDTDSKEELIKFAYRFFDIFNRVNLCLGKADLGMRAKNAINIYNETLESNVTHNEVIAKDGISIIIKDDSKLELSYMFRSIWIKRLPRKNIISELKENKNHLQTVALLCGSENRSELSDILARVGAVHISDGYNMSNMTPGESHDGVYPLVEYSRIVEIKK